MGYLQKLLFALNAFIGAKAGERPLLAMNQSRLFEGLRFTRYKDERYAWGELTTSIRLRVDMALQSKEASIARRTARDARRRLKPNSGRRNVSNVDNMGKSLLDASVFS